MSRVIWSGLGEVETSFCLETSTIKKGGPRQASRGDELQQPSSSSHPYLERPLSIVRPATQYGTLASSSRQPCHYFKGASSFERPHSWSLAELTANTATESSKSDLSTMSPMTSLSSPSMRLSRRAHSPLLGSSTAGEDVQLSSQESPYSASLASPRSTSPPTARQSKFIKRLNNRWLQNTSSRDSDDDGLDFGCIGVEDSVSFGEHVNARSSSNLLYCSLSERSLRCARHSQP